MKTIKIFIASSNELEKERLLMASLANDLSTKLEKVGIQVIAVEWENLDASMGAPHKQEEYNEKLRECDMCMVLYWTKFGMYTKTELDTAYNEKIAGKNPQKLWVYFKENDDPSKQQTEELKEFRDSFPTKYGHFYTPFANFDTLKAHFLLQFMEYQSQALQGKSIVEVKDGKVTVDGKEYVDLQNVPFAGNNEEYNDLIKDIEELQEDLEDMSPDNPRYARKAEKLLKNKEKLAKMESSLWETALMITKLSTTKCSERLQRAMELFNQGDNKGAQAVLNEEEIERDVQHNLNLIKLGEEGKKGLKTNIDEYLLKIQTYENEMEEGWEEKVISLYETCIKIGRGIIEINDFATILINYYDYLIFQGNYKKALKYSKECIRYLENLLGENHPKVIKRYKEVGDLWMDLDNFSNAADCYIIVLNRREKLLGINNPITIGTYNAIGRAFYKANNIEKAIFYFEHGLQLVTAIQDKYRIDPALWEGYGNLLREYGNYEKAIKLYTEAAQFYEKSKSLFHAFRLYNEVAKLFLKKLDYEKALLHGEKALSLLPKDSIHYKPMQNNIKLIDKKVKQLNQLQTNGGVSEQ